MNSDIILVSLCIDNAFAESMMTTFFLPSSNFLKRYLTRMLIISSIDGHNAKLKGLSPIPLGGMMGSSFAEHVWLEA